MKKIFFVNIIQWLIRIHLIFFLSCSNPVEPENKKPEASITAENYHGTTNEAITATATGTDSDGKVVKGYFGVEGNLHEFTGTSSTQSFTFDEPGKYVLEAYVIDNEGAQSETASSDTLYIEQGNRAPTLDFSASRTSITLGDNITLHWDAEDADGNLKGVHFNNDFYAESSKDTTITDLGVGTHEYSAYAEDEAGAKSGTKNITVVVNPANNNPPTHTLSVNPQNGTSSDDYHVKVNGADTDGVVDSTYIKVDDGAWAGHAGNSYEDDLQLAKGEHVISAYVKDNGGASSNPSSTQVSVAGTPGSLSITAPAGMINEGDNYIITWNYSDIDADEVTVTVWADDDNDPNNGTGTKLYTSSERAGQFSKPATTWNGSETVFAYVTAEQDSEDLVSEYGSESMINRHELHNDPGLSSAQGTSSGAALNDIVTTRPNNQGYNASVEESIDDVDFTIENDSLKVNIGSGAATGDHNYTFKTTDDQGIETTSTFTLHIDEGTQEYTIRGSVWNQTGDYTPTNATVFIKPEGGSVRTVPVDASGNFNTTYAMNGGTNMKIWMTADDFTNGTISILDPNEYAVNGIIASAAPFASPDTAEADLEDLALSQGVVMEGLADTYFYDNIFREMASGRFGTPGTIRRNTPIEAYFYTKDLGTGQPISQAMTDAINTAIGYRIDDQQQANGIILNHVYKTVHDTLPSDLNRLKNTQLIYQWASFPATNFIDEIDNEGYIVRHTVQTNTANLNVIAEEINEEYMDEYNGTLQIAIDNGRLNDLGRTINSFVHSQPLGTLTPQYTGQAASFMNDLKEKARKEQISNEQNGIYLHK